VPGLLVLLRGRGDSHASEFLGVVFAEQNVPFLTAFEDFLFLRSDALADLDFDLLLFLQDVGHGLDHVLTDGVAVLDELDFIALHQQIHDLVGNANDLLSAQTHGSVGALLTSLLAQDELAVAGDLPLHLLEHLLIGDALAAHFVLILGEDIANLFVDLILNGNLFHHAQPDAGDDRIQVLLLDFDQIAFDQLFDDFGGHVADIIPVQQHVGGVAFLVSKEMSLLGKKKIRKEVGQQ